MMWVVPSGVRTYSWLCSTLILLSILLPVPTQAEPSNQDLLNSINVLTNKVTYANGRLDDLENNLKIKLSDFLDEELDKLLEKRLNKTFEDPIERLKSLNNSVETVQITIDEFQASHDNSIQEIRTTHEDIHSTIQNFQNFSEASFDRINDNVNIFREIHNTSVQNILKTVEDVERCPEGFFKSPGTNQCLKVFMDDNNKKLTWEEADQKCRDENLTLAKPYNAVDLTNYLVERYGQTYYWVGAQGDGSSMTWQSEERSLLIDSHLWRPNGKPVDQKKTDSDSCLTLFAMNKNLKDNPGKPYYPATCKDNDAFPLCELILE